MPEFENLKLDNQLCFALYSATNRITRLYRSFLNEYELTYPQYLVLLVLWEKDGLAVRDIMNRLSLDSGTLSPILKRLDKAGFIWKERTTSDERVVKAYLTEKANALKPVLAEVQNKVACQTNLSDEEFSALLNKLNQLTKNLKDTN